MRMTKQPARISEFILSAKIRTRGENRRLKTKLVNERRLFRFTNEEIEWASPFAVSDLQNHESGGCIGLVGYIKLEVI